MSPKSYYIWTIGCQMNAADSRRMAAELEALGYRASKAAEDADVIVLNTCVVRQQAEDKIYGRLGSVRTVKEQRPETVVAVMGCLVGVREAPRLQERFPFVDVFLPPSETGPLMDVLANRGDALRQTDRLERSIRDAVQDAAYLLPAEQRGCAVSAFVPVVLGCSHACSFCVIPYRRGRERSRPRREVLDEIRALGDQGVREVMLLGQIVDRYGIDLDDDYGLAELLAEAHEVPGIERLRFLTSHPCWMDERLLRTVAELPKVCPQLEIPAQAGNDDVLERMRRGYTMTEYRRLIDRIRDRIPGAAIHTDMIVGFCGETEAQFEDSYKLLDEVRFDKVHIAKYSERPRTLATRAYRDDVSAVEKERRRKRLDDLQMSILTEKNRALLGEEIEVLVDGRRKGRWVGRSPQNKLVVFDDDRRDLLGRLVTVRVGWTGPYSLVGHGIEDEADELPEAKNEAG